MTKASYLDKLILFYFLHERQTSKTSFLQRNGLGGSQTDTQGSMKQLAAVVMPLLEHKESLASMQIEVQFNSRLPQLPAKLTKT